MKVYLDLPIPPSVNHCYVNTYGRGHKNRRLTDDAVLWKHDTALLARIAARKSGWLMPKKGEKIVLELVAYWPDGRRRDMNNCHKLLCDALENVLYIDDKCVLVRDIDYHIDNERPRMEVCVYPKDEE